MFYAQQHFSTARTDKESYILFYTLRGAGLIEQGESHVVLSTGQSPLQYRKSALKPQEGTR